MDFNKIIETKEIYGNKTTRCIALRIISNSLSKFNLIPAGCHFTNQARS